MTPQEKAIWLQEKAIWLDKMSDVPPVEIAVVKPKLTLPLVIFSSIVLGFLAGNLIVWFYQ